jgi:hypothetical protein
MPARQGGPRRGFLKGTSLALGIMCTVAPVQFVRFFVPVQGRGLWDRNYAAEGHAGPALRSASEGQAGRGVDGSPERLSGTSSMLRNCTQSGLSSPCSVGYRFAVENEMRSADLDGEFYLSRISCEFHDVLEDLCREYGLVKSYQSEREDWILTMVAAGMGICFLPEYTANSPGVVGCPVISPSVDRNVCLVTVNRRSLVTVSCGISASGAEQSLVVGFGHPKSAPNQPEIHHRRLA